MRNYTHPSFLVTTRDLVMDLRLTFRPVRVRNELLLDVGEALRQAVAVRFGSQSLHRIDVTATRGPA